MAIITQTGEGSAAQVFGTIDSGAELLFNQTGIRADYTLDAELAPHSKLTFNHFANGGVPAASRVVLSEGQALVITQQ